MRKYNTGLDSEHQIAYFHLRSFSSSDLDEKSSAPLAAPRGHISLLSAPSKGVYFPLNRPDTTYSSTNTTFRKCSILGSSLIFELISWDTPDRYQRDTLIKFGIGRRKDYLKIFSPIHRIPTGESERGLRIDRKQAPKFEMHLLYGHRKPEVSIAPYL